MSIVKHNQPFPSTTTLPPPPITLQELLIKICVLLVDKKKHNNNTPYAFHKRVCRASQIITSNINKTNYAHFAVYEKQIFCTVEHGQRDHPTPTQPFRRVCKGPRKESLRYRRQATQAGSRTRFPQGTQMATGSPSEVVDNHGKITNG